MLKKVRIAIRALKIINISNEYVNDGVVKHASHNASKESSVIL